MTCLRQGARYHDVVHQPQLHRLFSFQRRPWPTERQTDYLPVPKRRNHPLHDIPFGVTLAFDVALLAYLEATGLNHLCWHGQIPVWQDYPVKRELEVAFTEEMSRLLIGLQVSAQHASSGEKRPAELLHGPQVTQHRVTHRCCRRREIRLLQSTLQKRSGWHQLILGMDRWHQQQ